MSDERIVLRRVAWRELCPWLMIFRCFRLAISIPVLFLATIGTLLMPWGDKLARRLFEPEAVRISSPAGIVPPQHVSMRAIDGHGFIADRWLPPGWDVRGVYWSFVQPTGSLFDRTASSSAFMRSLLISVWNVAVWALFGAAITRIAIVHLGRDERVSLSDSLRYAVRNYGWYFSAPLFPLLGVILLALPLALLGLMFRFDFGVLLTGIVWPLVLLTGLAMAILLLGLLVGWPLMWPTISAEEQSDAFEAFSRSFSYSFQRPWQYLFYAVVTVLFGYLGWLLVGNFAEALIALSHWAVVSIGAGSRRTAEVLAPLENPSSLLWAGLGLIRGWDGFVRLIAQAFNYAFFFCTASAIYLLLRRQVDQTDFDEVFVPDDASRYGLPPLKSGPEGIPEPAETPKTNSE